MTSVIGIDLGVEGAAAYLDEKGYLEVFDISDCPNKLKDVLFWKGSASKVYAEKVGPRPVVINRQTGLKADASAKSNFRLGYCSGVLTTVTTLSCPRTVIYMSPMAWKKYYGLKGGKEGKEQSRLKAIELFPDYEHCFKRKKDHNRAEAALIANYGLMKEGKEREAEELLDKITGATA